MGKAFKLARQLGWKGLFTGYWTYSVGSLPSQAVYFLSYNWFKDKLQAVEDKRLQDKHKKTTGKQGLLSSTSCEKMVHDHQLFGCLSQQVPWLTLQQISLLFHWKSSFRDYKYRTAQPRIDTREELVFLLLLLVVVKICFLKKQTRCCGHDLQTRGNTWVL